MCIRDSVEGAFTGTTRGGKMGLFELAHNGTLFLDEISEIPLNMQSKLLRGLQEHEVRRIGDDRVTAVDVRIISATNVNLHKLVAAKPVSYTHLDVYKRQDYSLFAGMGCLGRHRTVLLRGAVAYEDGKILDDARRGVFLRGSLPA